MTTAIDIPAVSNTQKILLVTLTDYVKCHKEQYGTHVIDVISACKYTWSAFGGYHDSYLTQEHIMPYLHEAPFTILATYTKVKPEMLNWLDAHSITFTVMNPDNMIKCLEAQTKRVPYWMSVCVVLPDSFGNPTYCTYDDPDRGATNNVPTYNRHGKIIAGGKTASAPEWYDVPESIVEQIVTLAETIVPEEFKKHYLDQRYTMVSSDYGPRAEMRYVVHPPENDQYHVTMRYEIEYVDLDRHLNHGSSHLHLDTLLTV